ncbi:MAG: sensor histidine kinase [Chloroflexi bacterium]|nr:sensor histidine kinase [Chloroflexota bacterium]
MDRSFRPFKTGSDADLAFAVVVLASYFTTFSVLQSATNLELLFMISLGIAYIAVGIYGYAFVVHKGRLAYHLIYFTVQLFLGGMIVHMERGVGFNAMILLPLAGHSVVLLPRPWRLVVNAGILLSYVLAVDLFAANWSTVWATMPVFIAAQIFIVVFTQMAVNEERARGEVEKLVGELEKANHRLREYALQIEELAITKERNRLAREIHDGLGHYLTTIHMQIQASRAVMKTDAEKANEMLSRAQNMTQEALKDVRRSVAQLRDMPADSFSLQEEIEKMLKGCDGAGITSQLKVIGSPRPLSPQTILTLYRAVQEGINNTCKHSQANCISVTLDYSQSEIVRLEIQDDGKGAENIDGGFGLLGIRERTQLLNGDLTITTAPGNGFRLVVSLAG